jgi:hypothetical protein
MRIGKFQEWILVHALLKARNSLPPGWKKPNTWGPDYEATQWGKRYRQHYQDVLLKSEVLLNYFHLEQSPIKSKVIGQFKFKYDKGYRNALKHLGRALLSLREKGLIETNMWYFEFQPTTIKLTEKGKGMAVLLDGSREKGGSQKRASEITRRGRLGTRKSARLEMELEKNALPEDHPRGDIST